MSDAATPITPGHAEEPGGSCDCGCCEGITGGATPVVSNRPGLPAIAYRVGTHARFKQAMLARLSSADHPPLSRLRTRDDDDLTIALLDAWAAVADVLTFYQERIANESYLGTAGERLSVLELARLIGYRPRPGVAAEAHLAFTLETAAGAPTEVAVRSGTRVQSIPGPDERAQTFETVEDVTARPEWNALRPRASRFVKPTGPGDTSAFVAGVANNLRPGDAILLVGPERLSDPTSDRWDFHRLTRVEVDATADRTRIEWPPGPGSNSRQPSGDPDLYVFRLRASLFGYNAPHPNLLPQETRDRYGFGRESSDDWAFTFCGDTIDLDTVYPSITGQSWVVLARPGRQELYGADDVAEGGRSDYSVSGRTTRIDVGGPSPEPFEAGAYRQTAVFAESEPLRFAAEPITSPVWGEVVELDDLVDDPGAGRTVVVRGRRATMTVVEQGLTLAPDDGSGAPRALEPGELVTLLAAPVDLPGTGDRQWRLRTTGGVEGRVDAAPSALADTRAGEDEPPVAEVATLKAVEVVDGVRSRLVLISPLASAYDRASTEILANVARATHGESTGEVLGGGDGSRAHQRFALSSRPLTYLGADNPAGAESTLEVRVDDVAWQEVPSLLDRGPHEHVYTTSFDESGTARVQFGDGVHGARLPSGQDNVEATYRKGLGLDGLVGAGSLQSLLTRPLGVREVTNPLAAEGACDPETRDQARAVAPLTVLTLDRAVSLRDYEDFARAFAGVAKALATWSVRGPTRTVVVTVAGPDGAPVSADGPVRARLLAALRRSGDPLASFDVASYRPATFRVAMGVKVRADRRPEQVLAAVEAALRSAFGFETRSFGQPVALSEVARVAHETEGVVAVRIDRLHRTTPPNATPGRHTLLIADLPRPGAAGGVQAAELLTLDAGPIDLEVMP